MSTENPSPTKPDLYADVVERLRDILRNLDAATEAESGRVAAPASWEVARLERDDLSRTWGSLADGAVRQLARIMHTFGSVELVAEALDELDADGPHDPRSRRTEGLRTWMWLLLADAVRESDPEAWQRDVIDADDDAGGE